MSHNTGNKNALIIAAVVFAVAVAGYFGMDIDFAGLLGK